MTYIIHGATGAQGAPVHANLQASGARAIAAVRNTAGLDGPAVSVDLNSVESLTEAYREADGVFVHLPLAGPQEQLEMALAIGEAVRRARPGRVVFSTSGYTGDMTEPAGADSPHAVLWRALAESGVSYAVVAPRLFLENLLLPATLGPARGEGILRYPVRDDYAISWSSHIDIADVTSKLLTEHTVSGLVSVGALPGLQGADLAVGFAQHLGKDVVFEPVKPMEYGELIEPLFGSDAIAPVIASYEHRWTQQSELIDEARSAQRLLGIRPRSVEQWLHDLGV